MFTKIIYGLAIAGLVVSFARDRKKTKMALKKAWKSFENILPQFLAILVLIGLVLTLLSRETISLLLGSNSGVLGVLMAAFIGSITLIPGFVAFPLAAALFQSGAGVVQIAAFVSTLMMVGVVTLPLELKTFGLRAAILRNVSAFVFSLAAAFAMGVIL